MNREESSARGRLLWVAGLLALLTFGLYLQTGRFEFLNYDDPDYVTRNTVVARGLDADGVTWAFGFHASNWHPLTWMSHMLDVSLFGLEPGPMHRVNAALHALDAGLLFLALAALTRAFWPSLLAAALFAAHPLRVQSVAWIAERKDLLAAAFFLGALIAYERWARTRKPAAYVAVALCLLLGLLAKPMLVTAPFVLLLLDRWPLGRLGPEAADAPGRARVWLEKVPLLALALGSCVLTLLAQRAGGALRALDEFTFLERLGTAGYALLAYLRATLWPTGLAAFYPHPLLIGGSLLLPGALGLGLALALSLAAWSLRRRVPALFTGWFWFLGMLVPVLGLVQVGDQAWADRYTYLPGIGLAVALCFGLAGAGKARGAEAPERARTGFVGMGLVLAGLAVVGALAAVTLRTLPHWADSRALFEQALAVTEGNWIAHNNLGLVYLERRETDRALEHFQAASRLRPGFLNARFNLGLAQEQKGLHADAEKTYRALLADQPRQAEALMRLAEMMRAQNRNDEALALFEKAVEVDSDPRLWSSFARFLLDLGQAERAQNVAVTALQSDPSLIEAQLVLVEIALRGDDLDGAGERLAQAEARAPDSSEVCALRARWRSQKGDLAGARAAFERAILLDPGSARARHDYGALLMSQGELEGARNQFQALNDIRPGDPQALIGLAGVALGENHAEEAVRLLQGALRAQPMSRIALVNLGAAYEQLGEWSKALDCYKRSFQAGPPDPDAARNAAWILATGPDEELLDGKRALELASYAAQRQASNALEVLAAAQARNGDFEEAAALQEKLLQRARSAEQKRNLEERLELYRAGKPYTRP